MSHWTLPQLSVFLERNLSLEDILAISNSLVDNGIITIEENNGISIDDDFEDALACFLTLLGNEHLFTRAIDIIKEDYNFIALKLEQEKTCVVNKDTCTSSISRPDGMYVWDVWTCFYHILSSALLGMVS